MIVTGRVSALVMPHENALLASPRTAIASKTPAGKACWVFAVLKSTSNASKCCKKSKWLPRRSMLTVEGVCLAANQSATPLSKYFRICCMSIILIYLCLSSIETSLSRTVKAPRSLHSKLVASLWRAENKGLSLSRASLNLCPNWKPLLASVIPNSLWCRKSTLLT